MKNVRDFGILACISKSTQKDAPNNWSIQVL